jgi:hypothetical protein
MIAPLASRLLQSASSPARAGRTALRVRTKVLLQSRGEEQEHASDPSFRSSLLLL